MLKIEKGNIYKKSIKMKDKKIVELIELEQSKKWEYLKRYYEVTSK